MKFYYIIFVLIFIPLIAVADVNITVQPQAETVNYGEDVTVNISVDPQGTSISGIQLYVKADDDKLLFIESKEGDLFTKNNTTSWYMNGSNQKSYGQSGWILGLILSQNSTMLPSIFSTITFRGIGLGKSNISILGVIVASPESLPVNYSVAISNITITPITIVVSGGSNGRTLVPVSSNPLALSIILKETTTSNTSLQLYLKNEGVTDWEYVYSYQLSMYNNNQLDYIKSYTASKLLKSNEFVYIPVEFYSLSPGTYKFAVSSKYGVYTANASVDFDIKKPLLLTPPNFTFPKIILSTRQIMGIVIALIILLVLARKPPEEIKKIKISDNFKKTLVILSLLTLLVAIVYITKINILLTLSNLSQLIPFTIPSITIPNIPISPRIIMGISIILIIIFVLSRKKST